MNHKLSKDVLTTTEKYEVEKIGKNIKEEKSPVLTKY